MKTVFQELQLDTVISVREDTQFVLKKPTENGSYSLTLLFEKPGVCAEIIGAFILDAQDSIKLTTVTHHISPHTQCDTQIKLVLRDKAVADYVGKIIIAKTAQQTISFLEESALVTGDSIKNTSQPILVIDADDVKASHGSTTGKIDQDQLYYLNSRGLNLQEAEESVVKGFFEKILHKIIDNDVLLSVKNNLELTEND